MQQGYKYLEQVGAIEDNSLTLKGKLMSEFPTEPGFSVVIL